MSPLAPHAFIGMPSIFSYMFWHIELKFCMSLSSYEHLIKFECRHFVSIFEGVMPLLELWIHLYWKYTVFSCMLWHIELKFCTWLCFNVLQSKIECCHFASIFIRPSLDATYNCMAMSVRVSVCPSVTVFRTFLLHVLTYWAEILYVTFFLWTFDQVLVSSINIVHQYFNLEYWKYTVFHTYMLWHIKLKFFVLLYYRLSLSVVNSHQFL